MFRSSRNGIGLLTLRIGLASAFLLHLYRAYPSIAALSWPLPVFLVIAGALLAGALTTVACCLYCAADVFLLVVSAQGLDQALLVVSILAAIALALLGAGAYSVDAWIFGRRVIVLPNDRR